MLTSEMTPAFEGIFPSTIITSSPDGVPNITNLSRVWMINANQAAIANQLLNKTMRNLEQNPYALLRLPHPDDLLHWEIAVRLIRCDHEGELYRRVADDLQAAAWMAGASDSVTLRSVLVFEVLSCRRCVEDRVPAASEVYGDLLHVLADLLQWKRSGFWLVDERGDLTLAAIEGISDSASPESVVTRMNRLAELVRSEPRIVRLRNMSTQLRYLRTIAAPDQRAERDPPESFLGIPISEEGRLTGVIACEGSRTSEATFDRYDDHFLGELAQKLHRALGQAGGLSDDERKPLFRQVVELALLERAKSRDPFHTILSARERQVSVCVAQGMTNDQVARELFISKRTVTTHLERIYQKLEVPSRAALTRYVVEKGLLATPSIDPQTPQ